MHSDFIIYSILSNFSTLSTTWNSLFSSAVSVTIPRGSLPDLADLADLRSCLVALVVALVVDLVLPLPAVLSATYSGTRLLALCTLSSSTSSSTSRSTSSSTSRSTSSSSTSSRATPRPRCICRRATPRPRCLFRITHGSSVSWTGASACRIPRGSRTSYATTSGPGSTTPRTRPMMSWTR